MSNRNHILRAAQLLLLAWLLCQMAAGQSAARPNIVFILIDDLRWDALGALGSSGRV